MISHDYSWLGPGPGLAGVAPNDQSLPSRVQFFHQSGPYESYGGLPATIRRRISIRVFLDGSQVWLKPLLHQKCRKSGSGILIWAPREGFAEGFSRRCKFAVKSGSEFVYPAFLEVKRKNLTFPGSGKAAPGELGGGPPRFFLSIGMGGYTRIILWFPKKGI